MSAHIHSPESKPAAEAAALEPAMAEPQTPPRRAARKPSRPVAAAAPKVAAKRKPAAAAKRKPAAASKPPATAPAKPAKVKAKLVRDSFTMPQADFGLIAQLKERALGFKRPAKKSELLRAGLHALQSLDDAALRAALEALEALKPGRPRQDA
jgi:hypothetical protein